MEMPGEEGMAPRAPRDEFEAALMREYIAARAGRWRTYEGETGRSYTYQVEVGEPSAAGVWPLTLIRPAEPFDALGIMDRPQLDGEVWLAWPEAGSYRRPAVCWRIGVYEGRDDAPIGDAMPWRRPVSDDEVTAPQAAALLGIARTSVNRAIIAGRLAARRVGDIWLVQRAEVERYGREVRPGRQPAPRPDAAH